MVLPAKAVDWPSDTPSNFKRLEYIEGNFKKSFPFFLPIDKRNYNNIQGSISPAEAFNFA